MILFEPVVLPFLALAIGGLIVLGAEAFLGLQAKHKILPWIGMLAGVAALLLGIPLYSQEGVISWHGLFAFDSTRALLDGAIALSVMGAMAGLQFSLKRDNFEGGEPYALVLFSALGAMIMVHANDTLALFIGIELASLPVYALVGLRRKRLDSNEALLKYFLLGAVFSAIYLYGTALSYGATGSTQFGQDIVDGREGLFRFGQLLMLIGLFFKVGLVPFHFWAPDAYTGAPLAVTGYMAAVMKVAGFAALGAIWLSGLAIDGEGDYGVLALSQAVTIASEDSLFGSWSSVLIIVGVLSLFVGNFSALGQSHARRMLAYSSIAHAGYVIFSFIPPMEGGVITLSAAWYYLVAYTVATAGLVCALQIMSGAQDDDSKEQLRGQARRHPFAGFVATISLISLAGLPASAGFLGKFLIFSGVIAHGHYGLAIAAMLLAVVGAVYYLRLLASLWADEPAKEEEFAKQPALLTINLIISAIIGVALLFGMNCF